MSRMRARSLILIVPVCLLLAVAAWATLTVEDAGEPGFPNDPGFAGSVIVPLDENLPFGLGDDTFVIDSNGVQFTFFTSGGFALFCFGPGDTDCDLIPNAFTPVIVTAIPPVSALGFVLNFGDGPVTFSFNSDAGNEDYVSTFDDTNVLIGASNIGNISSAHVDGFGVLSDLVFATGGDPGEGQADLAVSKSASNFLGHPLLPETYDIQLTNEGPDASENTVVIDFLPPGSALTGVPTGLPFPTGTPAIPATAVQWDVGQLAAGDGRAFDLDTVMPPLELYGCEGTLVNVVATTGTTPDPNIGNNLAVLTQPFDEVAQSVLGEICSNGIDDDCNGRIDCDDPACLCIPLSIHTSTGSTPPPPSSPGGGPASNGNLTCRSDDAAMELLPYCCCEEPPHPGSCDNCGPKDPNRKESDPPVNTLGYGITEAGRTHTYTITYENIGAADAHDVSIVDVLHPDLDDSTLVVLDGGVYDPATRAIVWSDPVLPPAEPRSVSFMVDVRADLTPHSRVRNVATVIFPDADPPSRIDTNFVEHTMVDPAFPVVADPVVVDCVETATEGEWIVILDNRGYDTAYNVSATILDPPASVSVIEGTARFAHPDDVDPDAMALAIPLATTESREVVRFTTQTPESPCDALLWRIEYQNGPGENRSADVRAEPDPDRDGVADHRDNCPDIYNPTQADSDGNGTGNVCEEAPCDLGDDDDDDDDAGCGGGGDDDDDDDYGWWD